MPAFRLLNSTAPKPSFQGVVPLSLDVHSVEIQENTPAFMRLNAYDSHHHLGCTMELALANTPNFLHKHIEAPLDHVLLCSNLTLHKPSSPLFADEILSLVLSLKILIQCLEELYTYSAKKAASGLLFVITEDQISLMSPFEDLVSYAESYPTEDTEKTLFFIPTDLASYDLFIEFKEEMLKHLDQLLWSQQRTSPLIRHYLKTTTLRA